jgi:ATP-dependent RNA helicase DDX27
VNFDAPRTLETYLHRIGRTARAGAGGASVTLAEDADRKLLREVVKRGGAALKQRLVPAAAVAAWQAKVERAQPDVEEVRAGARRDALPCIVRVCTRVSCACTRVCTSA